ncbi:3',5'-cyclic adenosine monophosphate phosphodiesterase [Vibrio phage VH1_2019]|uniref:3',5'-cyclic adenosine monophosphate phosphodiesterase n=2 Tax=Schizotequatrovirus KVP40 TaxID=1914019 RepID=A0A6B9SSY0_9CAUD|nr:Ser/Thr protein phosphatase family protein [Vibrio phage phi-pp2]QHJ74233.1 3',5'-cyclic adenosine monophosphate phosphodiesterase [Vibrio phage VH1_2019]
MANLKVYYCSDIHNDYHDENALERITGDKDAVLVVAGDINSKGRTVRDLEAVADRWRAVIAVPGNHDWWGLAIHERHKFETSVDNVHVLLEDTVQIDDVTFCGTTLWHEVNDWFEGQRWKENMNDRRKIRGPQWRPLYGEDVHALHCQSVKFIEKCREIEGKKVLITHHAPSLKSISSYYAYSSTNSFYCTDLEHLLEGFNFAIHGHVHQEFDYHVNGCNVLCNPRAYGSENPDYGLRIFDI